MLIVLLRSGWLCLMLTAGCAELEPTASDTGDLGTPGNGLPAEEVLFRSDWSAATGDSQGALTDNGAWDEIVCPLPIAQQVLTVVPGSDAGWTATANVLRVRNRGQENCGQVEERSSIERGQDFFVRMYIRVEDESQPNFHPVDLNCCGAIQSALWAIFDPVSGVDYNPKLSFETPAGDRFRRWKPREKLRQGTWYRFEWHVDILDAGQGTVQIWPRIYDMSGALLYDASSFIGIDQSGETLAQFYGRGGVAQFSDLDLARRYAVGYEGTGGARDQGKSWYYAAVEIRSDTWPGAVR